MDSNQVQTPEAPKATPGAPSRGLLSQPLLDQGYTTYNDLSGQPCVIGPDVSELEHTERRTVEIGGSSSKKDRRTYYKWKTYHSRKIRKGVLKLLLRMSLIEVPEKHKAPAFTTGFDIEDPEDFGELVAMLTADLARLVKAKKQIARRKKVASVVRNRVANDQPNGQQAPEKGTDLGCS
jgi:hypothetical protein